MSFIAVHYAVSNTRLVMQDMQVAQTLVKGLPAGSRISYMINPAQKDADNIMPAVLSDSVLVNERGIAHLPSFNPAFNKYVITVEDNHNPLVLSVGYNENTQRVSIKGSGFDKFA
ncbi:MAG: hypothetical protein ACLFR0_08285, partial [Alphaproteobacteria bacterium]